MELAKYKACICEGSAEEAIIDILVDNDLLIFNREEMLEERVIRCRSAKRFEERYLRKGFDEQISVIRILDSRREEFRLSKAYEQKIDVVNVITAPEIEMLIIHAEGAYAVKKDRSSSPPKYLIFFKGRDADALTAAFTEYTGKKVRKAEKSERPSVLAKLSQFKELVKHAVVNRNKRKELER